MDGAVLAQARRVKQRTCPELLGKSWPRRLVVLSRLAKTKARSMPQTGMALPLVVHVCVRQCTCICPVFVGPSDRCGLRRRTSDVTFVFMKKTRHAATMPARSLVTHRRVLLECVVHQVVVPKVGRGGTFGGTLGASLVPRALAPLPSVASPSHYVFLPVWPLLWPSRGAWQTRLGSGECGWRRAAGSRPT